MGILNIVSTEYREKIIRYYPDENNWKISGEYQDEKYRDRTFISLKAAASFIDRKIAAMKRIEPFFCLVRESNGFSGERNDLQKQEVIGIIDENSVWLRVETRNGETRKKLDNVGSETLYVDNDKNLEISNKVKAIEDQIYNLKEVRDEYLDMLDPINLREVIAAKRDMVSDTDTTTDNEGVAK
jgi:hypothetical protein